MVQEKEEAAFERSRAAFETRRPPATLLRARVEEGGRELLMICEKAADPIGQRP